MCLLWLVCGGFLLIFGCFVVCRPIDVVCRYWFSPACIHFRPVGVGLLHVLIILGVSVGLAVIRWLLLCLILHSKSTLMLY